MKTESNSLRIILGVGLALGASQVVGASEALADKGEWVAPVTNPFLFESPVVTGEVRPLFFYHNLNDDFVSRGGHVEVYGIQFRAPLTDRLAVLLTKAAYAVVDPNQHADRDSGWGNIALGVKYALIDAADSQFIVTPGLTFELPTGERSVLQGYGDGKLNPFVSAAKGFGPLQFMGNVGIVLPLQGDAETTQLHYSVQATYAVWQWFKPFVAFNGYYVLSDANDFEGTWRGNLDSEGYDLVNFGSSSVNHEHLLVFGLGWRSQVLKNLDFGFAYEKGVTADDGIFDDRFTVDLLFRF